MLLMHFSLQTDVESVGPPRKVRPASGAGPSLAACNVRGKRDANVDLQLSLASQESMVFLDRLHKPNGVIVHALTDAKLYHQQPLPQHLKVLASLRKVDVKFGPLNYDGCGGSGPKGRMCLTRLDADGTCRVCGQPSNVVPVLMMDRAGFEADDGATFRLTAFGGVATSIVGITGEDAQALEAESVAEGDSSRSAVVNKIKWSFGRSFEVGVTANRNVTEDGKPFLNAKIFEVALATTSLDPKVFFNVL